jgi:hypothetical protein
MTILPLVGLALLSAQRPAVADLGNTKLDEQRQAATAALAAAQAADRSLLKAQDRATPAPLILVTPDPVPFARPVVVCGLTIVPAAPTFDARMTVRDSGTSGATIRSIPPPMCNPSTVGRGAAPPR